MMRESLWSKTVEMPKRDRLSENLRADAAVIGGGMAGVLIASFLQTAGLKTVLLEAARIGSGQTQNTTAKITSQHGAIYHKLIKQFGKEKAEQYAKANEWAISEYRRIVKEQKIECDFTETGAWLYALSEKEELEKECRAAEMLRIDASLHEKTELPFPVASALRFGGQARFHPLLFLRKLAEPLKIYEQTQVESVEEKRVVTSFGMVTADFIIFASHYPFVNIPGYYFMRMHQERSYVLALENAAPIKEMYLGIDSQELSFRPQEDLLLLGGGNHRTGENSAGGQYQNLREAANRYWPQSREVACWSAQDCMTLDGVPYIGRFSSSRPNWYVATGFEKWGMTSSMVSAGMIADLIVKGESPWEPVFSPQRFTPSASAKALFEETAHAVRGLARKVFAPPKAFVEALPKGHGGVVEYEGEKAGVYKDEKGKIFAVSVRCPHLGCQLEWNPEEKSWDCPCHGSRFDFCGRLLNNPAEENLLSEEETPEEGE